MKERHTLSDRPTFRRFARNTVSDMAGTDYAESPDLYEKDVEHVRSALQIAYERGVVEASRNASIGRTIPAWSSPSHVTREDLLQGLCRTLETVWHHFDKFGHHPNDCFCGLSRHRSPHEFRSSGQALAWVQDVVGEAIRALRKEREHERVERPSEDD